MTTDVIRVLLPYFGPWPFWMPAFLASCRPNAGITWYLFGDHPLPVTPPPNVKFERLSFSAYCTRVSQKLGICFAPPDAYKLCDLKPALGAVHQELLEDCDYWAFSDLDLVYGDLLGHFEPLLAKWDIISTHARRVSGHFCIFRNNEACRQAFKRVPGWRTILECPDHQFFDEGAFSRSLHPHKRWPQWMRRVCYIHDPLIRRGWFAEEFTSPCRDARLQWLLADGQVPQFWHWSHGRLTNSLTGERTFPYFHFIDWKATAWKQARAPLWQLEADRELEEFVISPQGFASRRSALGEDEPVLDSALDLRVG